jgi:hypothetical protein
MEGNSFSGNVRHVSTCTPPSSCGRRTLRPRPRRIQGTMIEIPVGGRNIGRFSRNSGGTPGAVLVSSHQYRRWDPKRTLAQEAAHRSAVLRSIRNTSSGHLDSERFRFAYFAAG